MPDADRSLSLVLDTRLPDFRIGTVELYRFAPGETATFDDPEIRMVSREPLVRRGVLDTSFVYELLITLGTGVASGVAANWLYNVIRGKTEKALLNGRDVTHLDAAELAALVAQELKKLPPEAQADAAEGADQ